MEETYLQKTFSTDREGRIVPYAKAVLTRLQIIQSARHNINEYKYDEISSENPYKIRTDATSDSIVNKPFTETYEGNYRKNTKE